MRLTPEDIANAFEVTGLEPIRRAFGDDSVGCGMQAYALAHEEFRGQPRLVSLKLVGRAYFEGFATGWDYGDSSIPDDLLMTQYGIEGAFRYFDGLADGAAAAERMFDREPALA